MEPDAHCVLKLIYGIKDGLDSSLDFVQGTSRRSSVVHRSRSRPVSQEYVAE